MKRFLCVSVFIFTALVAVMALSPSAALAANYNAIIWPGDSVDTNAYFIQSAINKAAYGDTVTVSGGKYGESRTLTLTIPYGRTVIWRADYTYFGYTSAIELFGYGAFVVADGGFIAATEAYCYAIDSYGDVAVSGGEVRATGYGGVAIYCSGDVTVYRGIVSALGAYGTAIYSEGDVTVHGGSRIEAPGTRGVAINADGILALSSSAYITGDIFGHYAYPSEADSSGCNSGLGLFSLALLSPLVLKRRSI